MEDEPVVGVHAVFVRHDLLQFFFHLVRRGAGGEAGAVGDPEDMRVYCHGRLREGHVEDDIRGFTPDAGELHQFVAIRRNLAAVIIDEDLGEGVDILRLGIEKTDGFDVVADFVFAECDHFLRRVGGLEEGGGCLVHALVRGLRGQRDGDEQGERVRPFQFALRFRINGVEAAEKFMNFIPGHARPAFFVKKTSCFCIADLLFMHGSIYRSVFSGMSEQGIYKMTLKMTVMAAMVFGAGAIGSVSAQEISTFDLPPTGDRFVTNTDRPPEKKIPGHEEGVNVAAMPGPQDPRSLLGGIPYSVYHVGRTDLTIYLSPKAENESVLVVEDYETGKVCVQQHSLVPDEVFPFACYDIGEVPATETDKATMIYNPPPGDLFRSRSVSKMFESITLQRGSTAGSHIGLQIDHEWDLARHEVCMTLIQTIPSAAITEAGCRKMTFREVWDKLPKNGPRWDV